MSLDREKQLCATWFQDGLTDDDRTWLREQIELGGERVPDVDISWLSRTETGTEWGWSALAGAVALLIAVVAGPLVAALVMR